MIEFNLLKAVVKQIQEDAEHGDYTAIEDLLKDIPKKRLVGFLKEITNLDVKRIVGSRETDTKYVEVGLDIQ